MSVNGDASAGTTLSGMKTWIQNMINSAAATESKAYLCVTTGGTWGGTACTCQTNAENVNGACVCKENYVFNEETFKCDSAQTTN